MHLGRVSRGELVAVKLHDFKVWDAIGDAFTRRAVPPDGARRAVQSRILITWAGRPSRRR